MKLDVMESHLKWADYLILVGFLVISLAIGIYHSLTGGRQKTVAEFIMGDRRLSVIPTAISLFVSYYSAIHMLGMTAEMYLYGVQYLIFITFTPTLALIFVERFIVPWLYPLKLVSVYDYLERRFMSKTIRIFGAALGILFGVLFMGAATYAPSAALESATGLQLSVSIPLMAVVSVSYTALGGMRAVIWTDVFQFVIMMTGIIAIFVKGLFVVGGISNVFRLAGEEGRLVWANFDFDPRVRHTVWSFVFGLGIASVNRYGLLQTAVQRFSAVDKLSKARALTLLNIPPLIAISVMSCLTGLVILAYYSSVKCDPLANKDIASPNMLLPHFVVTIFADSPGVSGIFLAALYGGALSTMSSMLSGLAANAWEDILKWRLNHLTESRKVLINRILVVLFGALSTGVAFLSASIPGPITQVLFTMSGLANGPLAAFFFLGGISKHANWKGTLLGGIVGVLMTFWLGVGSMMIRYKHPPLPPVSVEQCYVRNGSSTLFNSTLNYSNYTAFEGIDATDNWNGTSGYMPGSIRQMVNKLRGLENFYALSYLWFFPFGAIVTGVVGIIASFIMRDRDLEAKVDERLLIRFYGCGCTDGNKDEDQLDEDKTKTSLQGTEVLKGPEDDVISDVEMTSQMNAETVFIRKAKAK